MKNLNLNSVTVSTVNALVNQLGLVEVNNSMPKAEGVESVLYGSADNKLFFAVSKTTNEAYIGAMVQFLKYGMNVMKESEFFNIEVSDSTPNAILADREWNKKLTHMFPHGQDYIYSTTEQLAGKPMFPGKCHNTSIAIGNGEFLSITEIMSDEAVTEEVAHSYLSGKAMAGAFTEEQMASFVTAALRVEMPKMFLN